MRSSSFSLRAISSTKFLRSPSLLHTTSSVSARSAGSFVANACVFTPFTSVKLNNTKNRSIMNDTISVKIGFGVCRQGALLFCSFHLFSGMRLASVKTLKGKSHMGEPTSPMLERLQEFLKVNPKDSFVRYGYSMELSKLGRIDEAVASFRQLIQDDPGYVPAYMQAGSVLMRAGRKEEAKEVFLQGITAAARAGETHAYSELQGMLAELSL